MTGPRVHQPTLAELYAEYQATQRAGGAPSASGTPSLAALHAEYLAQQGAPDDPDSAGKQATGFARAVGQGVTFGFGDELEAGVRAPFSEQSYAQVRDAIRASQRDYATRHPIANAAGEIGGGLATAFIPLAGEANAARALTAGARITRAAKLGTAAGALYGFGKGEGDAGAQIKSTIAGATLGAATGGALQGTGEAGKALWRAANASPRLLAALARVAPTDALTTRAQGASERAMNAAVDETIVGRLARDNTTPAQAAAIIRDAPESIPVAVVDAGGESTRQGLGALKRLPGDQKDLITKVMQARDENAPVWLQRSIARNTGDASGALGIPAEARIDTRTANPNTVVRAAQQALTERSNTRYAPAMEGAAAYDADAVARLDKLLTRPSMQRAQRLGVSLAKESGETVPPLRMPTPAGATATEVDASAAALRDAQTALRTMASREGRMPEAADLARVADMEAAHADVVAASQVPAVDAAGPTVRQLHYLKMGLDEQINALEARQASLRMTGAKPGATNTRLAKLYKTKGELLKVVGKLAPDYTGAMEAHAAESAPISAFQQGRRLTPTTDAEEIATRAGALPSDEARTGLGAGYARSLQRTLRSRADAKADPVKAIVGSGSASGNATQNLRQLLPDAAPAIERDAALVARIKRSNAKALGGSPTDEYQQESANTAETLKKVRAVLHMVTGRPAAAIADIAHGTYGPAATRTAERLVLGADPGQRQAVLRYLMELEQSAAAQRARTGSRTAPLNSVLGGLLGGSVGSSR